MHVFFQIKSVEEKLGFAFKNPFLLLEAFVHRSFWNENQTSVPGHNERLEFLGDSVLGLLVADYLFQNYPGLDEGCLSKLRSQLVDAPACAQYVQQLDVGGFLLLGKGEKMNQGKGRESIMADLFEAIIGAIYLDQGIEAVCRFFFTQFKTSIDRQISSPQRNWKADLQDWAQRNYQQTPSYTVTEESGPAHQKIFQVAVCVQGVKWGEGMGSSKKEAQIHAAQKALYTIENELFKN